MNAPVTYSSREEQAKAEIGVTAISPRLAIGMTAVFLLTVCSVCLIDQLSGTWRAWSALGENQPLHRRLHDAESALEDQSRYAHSVRPIVQRTLRKTGASGLETVDLGRDGWLFYDADVRYVTERGFLEPAARGPQAARQRRDAINRQTDPIVAISDFNRQLKLRGISLLIVPTPLKPMIEPQMLASGARGPVNNRSFAQFKREMEARGVLVFDPATALASARGDSAQYLKKDTHWRPEAMELAAAKLADFVKQRVELPQSLGVEFGRSEVQVRGLGDLAAMLDLRGEDQLEAVPIHPIRQPDQKEWSPKTDAEILWLGDSFSNIYSAPVMGWGGAAGFAEQFSYYLGRPIDALRRNDQGAFATRQMLADELARGNDRLAGKKLMIWQFADRELAQGDWKLIELKLNPRPAKRFLVPPPGEIWTLEGVVSAKGATPRPGNVAYRDHIMAIHLSNLSVDGKVVPGGQAIVYLRSMIDNKLTPAASLQIGQTVRMKARDWSEVARRYEFINRSDLPDASLRAQPACWGELTP